MATNIVGIYVRVSRKGEREDGRFHSPREQAERASGLAAAQGYVPGPVFEDIDVSGAMAPQDRPAMRELLERVESGELAGIAAFSLDRLSREPAHGDALVKRVTKAGGVILTPDIPDAIDTPTGEFTFGMLLQVAKLYRSQAGARFASATERATRAGIPVAQVPIGYRQRPDRVLEVDPTTAPVVREMFERRAAGAPWRELVELLDEATGRTWSRTGAQLVIRNRLYATGRLEYAGVVSEVEAGAIVDEPLWHAAQAVAPPRPKRNPDSPFILTGLVRCSSCGTLMQTWRGSKTRRNAAGELVEVTNRARRYRCATRHCEAPVSVDGPRLERMVVAQTMLLDEELEARGQAPDLKALEDALAKAERRYEQARTPEARDALGDDWAADVKARRLERDEAAAALGAARQAEGIGPATFRLRDVWEDYSAADRRSALSLFWREVRVAAREDGRTEVRFTRRGGPALELELPLPAVEAA